MNPFSYQNSPAPVAVVGAGNGLIRHDRIGPDVILRCRNRFGSKVDVIDVGITGLALLDYLAQQELMIIVDACCNIGRRGEILVLEPDLDSPAVTSAGSHQIGALETLVVANVLHPEILPGKIVLILVETNGLDDTAMENACDKTICIIEEKIERWRHRKS